MITEFDSIFHENGFIFVNEMKKDIEAQMADRVASQRSASELGHELIGGKGELRKMRKGSGGYKKQGYKIGGADNVNIKINKRTGGPNNNTIKDPDFLNRKEKKRQEARKIGKGLASTMGQKKLGEAIKKQKEKQAVNASALMESIELI